MNNIECDENQKYLNTLLENTSGKHFIFAGSDLRKALKAQSIISKTEAYRDIIEIIKKKGSEYAVSILENHLK